jgi:hypothetical protein
MAARDRESARFDKGSSRRKPGCLANLDLAKIDRIVPLGAASGTGTR